MKRTQIFMNKPGLLSFSKLEISKIVMYEFWYDYRKLKYDEKAKLCYMDTDSLKVLLKTEDIYSNIGKNIEIRFDASNYELHRPLPNEENKKVAGLMKGQLGGIMTEFAALRQNL